MANTDILTCERCGLTFEVPKGVRRKFCKECKWEMDLEKPKYAGVKKKPRKFITPTKSLEEINREIAAYNKEHGTRLTYGKYMALKRMGKIL